MAPQLLKLVCLISILHLSAEEGLWNLQLSPQTVASVPFGSAHVSVWEHATDRGRFYAMPQACLLPHEVRVRDNVFTGRTELTLHVLMWSKEAREAVQRYLVTHVNTTVHQIDVIPMERVRLVWADRVRPLADHYQVVDNWQSNTHLPTVVRFTVVCSDAERCQALKEGILQDPHLVNGLELQYEISARKAARRQLKVTGSDLVKGNLYTRLVNMNAASPVRYLSSDDIKRLTSETVQNVISTAVTDEDYVEREDEASVTDLLERVFQRQKVSSGTFTPLMWNSVYWDQDHVRPDQMTAYLNKVLSVNATNSSNFDLDQTQRSTEAEVSMGLFDLLRAGSRGSSSISRGREELLSSLRQRFPDVQWSEDKFIVRHMTLTRINLATLNTSSNIAVFNVQVRRYESAQSVKLRPRCGVQNQTSGLTPDLVQARLNERMDDITRSMTDRIDVMNNRMTDRMDVMNNRMTDRIDVMNNRAINHMDVMNSRMTDRMDVMNNRTINRIDVMNNRMTDRMDVMNNRTINRMDVMNNRTINRIDVMNNRTTDRLDAMNNKMTDWLDIMNNKTTQTNIRTTERLEEMSNRTTERLEEMNIRMTDRLDNMNNRMTNRMDDLTNKITDSMDVMNNSMTNRMAHRLDNMNNRTTQRLEEMNIKMTDRMDDLSDRMTTAINSASNTTITTMNEQFKVLVKLNLHLSDLEFCYLPDHRCQAVSPYSEESGVSLSDCRSRCLADARCKAFDWYRVPDRCRLKAAVCPMDKLRRDTTEVYYVKTLHTPIASMAYLMRFMYQSNRRGDLCQMIRQDFRTG